MVVLVSSPTREDAHNVDDSATRGADRWKPDYPKFMTPEQRRFANGAGRRKQEEERRRSERS